MNILIDIVLVLIVVFFAWRGFKNGFIRGIFGILAIVIAIYGANLVAKAYSGDFKGMLEPFVSGVVDKAVSDIISTDDDAESSDSEQTTDDAAATEDTTDVAEGGKSKSVYEVSYTALRNIGISEAAARQISEKVGGKIDDIGSKMSADLTSTLCSALAYIAVFAVAFILLAIIFAVIGNIFNLAFSIPGIEAVDKIIGLVLGILKGLLIILVLAVIIRYFGLLASDTIEKTAVLKYILNINPLASILGV